MREASPLESAGTTVADLCRGLDSPNVWWRDRAHRLLVERADPAAAPLLEQLARGAKLAETRTLALWILRGLGRLSSATVATALRDRDSNVREQGVKLAAELLAKAPDVRAALMAMGGDELVVPEHPALGGFGYTVDGKLFNLDGLKYLKRF